MCKDARFIVNGLFTVEFVVEVGLHQLLLLRRLSFMIAPKVLFVEMRSRCLGEFLNDSGLKGQGGGVG